MKAFQYYITNVTVLGNVFLALVGILAAFVTLFAEVSYQVQTRTVLSDKSVVCV
jgi:preprotein translocase subunit SecY